MRLTTTQSEILAELEAQAARRGRRDHLVLPARTRASTLQALRAAGLIIVDGGGDSRAPMAARVAVSLP